MSNQDRPNQDRPNQDRPNQDRPAQDDRIGSAGRPRLSPVRAGLAGALAAMAALAVGELAAALAPPRPGPVLAVANRVVDGAPSWFVELGKSLFGLADKPALVVGTTILCAGLGALAGLFAIRSRMAAVGVFLAFGVVGVLAIGTDARGGWISALLIVGAAVLAGLATLAVLLPLAVIGPATQAEEPTSQTRTGEPPPIRTPGFDSPSPVARRSFLGWASVAAGTTVGLGLGARVLRGRNAAEEARANVVLPQLEDSAETLATGGTDEADTAESAVVAGTAGITPLVIPNDEFYRIDTAILVPQVDPASWSLRIHGMVADELVLTYDELLQRATTVAPVTLSCVSNEVGGDLVGNAIWRGVPLAELLDEAGVLSGADQIRSASVDGWDCGFPTEAAFDGRTAMVAVAMNDEPLPIRHGFPARLVVAGLYGYVSATKWLSEIELTTLDSFDGYWIPRGWSKFAPVKTQSRIDTPRNGSTMPVGRTTPIAGVAWAPNTGIERVEVRIGDGPWQETILGESLGPNAWRQWRLEWTPTEAGSHRVQVRATDASGYTQTEERAAPAPDGATGWHTVELVAS